MSLGLSLRARADTMRACPCGEKPMKITIIPTENSSPTGDALLARCEAVHRQLRPQLPSDYTERMREILSSGAQMIAAEDEGQVLGVAVFRIIENSFEGRKLYVDDLVTDESKRSQGVGSALMNWLEAHARKTGCSTLALDSGSQRHRAHGFYFRQGLHIASYSFRKLLDAQ